MMRITALVLSLLLPASVAAGVVHDEAINGDLSSDPAQPTVLNFSEGGNTVSGTSNGTTGDQDYFTFTVPSGDHLVQLNMVTFSPANICFGAFTTGTRSFEPTVANNNRFLAGIHMDGSMVGTDLMPQFVSNAVTANSLSVPELGPGDYSFAFQQGSIGFVTSYTLEFVLESTVPVQPVPWGRIKAAFLMLPPSSH